MSIKTASQICSLIVPVAGLFASQSALASPPEPIFDRWLTDDRAAIVVVKPCGEKLCGWVEKVLDPKAPTNDINNPKMERRSKPLVGTPIFWSFVRSGGGWKDGRAYDPKTGNIYRSKLKVLESGELEVTGCVLFLCQSRHWTPAPQAKN